MDHVLHIFHFKFNLASQRKQTRQKCDAVANICVNYTIVLIVLNTQDIIMLLYLLLVPSQPSLDQCILNTLLKNDGRSHPLMTPGPKVMTPQGSAHTHFEYHCIRSQQLEANKTLS